jgi:hypothetical protein
MRSRAGVSLFGRCGGALVAIVQWAGNWLILVTAEVVALKERSHAIYAG